MSVRSPAPAAGCHGRPDHHPPHHLPHVAPQQRLAPASAPRSFTSVFRVDIGGKAMVSTAIVTSRAVSWVLSTDTTYEVFPAPPRFLLAAFVRLQTR